MPLFLTPRTSPNAGIGICSRCRKKSYLSDLKSDPNFPGLYVHSYCADVLDPYRKALRNNEDIALPHPRPDEKLE